ncbi:MAG: YfhO family protein, partial [Prevotellaceae bacterium]|nr:YfhO family protein [Prevotellaceae bacterium]
LLSWGKNLAWFNDFLFYHLPFYNKFRTPSMALVIAQFTVPLLVLLALKDLFDRKTSPSDFKKGLKYALGIAGGICLLFSIAPGMFFDFRSPYDATYNMPDWYYTALLSDRASLLRSDAFRSLVFIALAAGTLYLFMKGTLKSGVYVAAAIAALALVDLWQVDKRYLNDDNFTYQKNQKQQFAKSRADELILQDTSLSYRVLSLNNPFNDSFVSYYHKSIGGYNAAKLRRYQELIERRITPEMQLFTSQAGSASSAAEMEALMDKLTTLNMLNMRYIIYNKDAEPIRNDAAYGNAWFVENFQIVENADAEMAALDEINPRKTAVVDKRFEQHLAAYQSPQADENASIRMTAYKPNAVTYESHSDADRLAIFSEVYYAHGWKAYIDGQPAPHFRASWILRGMVVPAGEHKIEFRFHPDGYYSAIKISRASSSALLLVLAGGIALALRRAKTASNLPTK